MMTRFTRTHARQRFTLTRTLSMSLAMSLLLVSMVEASRGDVRRIETVVEVGSVDNSLTVRIDKRDSPAVVQPTLRFSSRVPSLLHNARIERLERTETSSQVVAFRVLFDVAPEASRWARHGSTELRLGLAGSVDGVPARFDTEEIVLALEIEPSSPEPPVMEPAETEVPDDDFGGWGDAVSDARRETERSSLPRPERPPVTATRPRPRVPDIASRAGDVAERARSDKARNRARVGGILDTISTIADTFGRKGGAGQPPVHAPVFPTGDIPGQPAATPRANPTPGQSTGPSGVRAPSATTAEPGCVVFDQLHYGNDGHFLVRVESGRPGDAIGYYVVSVPAQNGASCSGSRSCLDFYLRSALPGQRTRVLGSYRSRSAATRAARQACPNPLNR